MVIGHQRTSFAGNFNGCPQELHIPVPALNFLPGMYLISCLKMKKS